MIFRGKFVNLFPMYPASGLRKIHLKDGKEDIYLTAFWKTFENQLKGIKLNDNIEIDYKDHEHFTMKKISHTG